MATPATDFLAAAARALVEGEPGAEVVRTLQTRHSTLHSLQKALSNVRAILVDGGHRPPEYDTAPLRAAMPDAAEVRAFLDAPLREQLKIQRAHRANPTWPAAAEAALGAVQLLPPNAAAFALTKAQAFALKRKREDSLVARNESVVVVAEAARLVEACTTALKEAHAGLSFPRLAVPLLVLSGRRSAEMMGAASFEPGPVPKSAVFAGQLKRKGAPDVPYVIPLLCDFAVFQRGVRILRSKQGGALAPEGVHTRYQPSICRAIKSGIVPHLPETCHAHDCRAIYSALVYHAFVSPYSAPRTAMLVLGHHDLEQSLSYGAVRLEKCDALRGAFGPLPR